MRCGFRIGFVAAFSPALRAGSLFLLGCCPLAIGVIGCGADGGSSEQPEVYELLATDADGLGLDIPAGASVRITATGEVNTNPDGPVIDCDLWTDADGIPDCQYVSDPESHGLPFMALIGTFDDGDYFLVGTEYEQMFSDAGQLRLEINDWVFVDNAGSFTVSVLITASSSPLSPSGSS
jgi:hypothetical protein